jgi:hypothetical protein
VDHKNGLPRELGAPGIVAQHAVEGFELDELRVGAVTLDDAVLVPVEPDAHDVGQGDGVEVDAREAIERRVVDGEHAGIQAHDATQPLWIAEPNEVV